eukprot:SAG31_NODE_4433_length_3235_cov_1.532844_2_plen_99_part_00
MPVLSNVLWHMASSVMPQLARLCVGVASIGKTFIQAFVHMFCSMFMLVEHASVMVGPTGLAARNCMSSILYIPMLPPLGLVHRGLLISMWAPSIAQLR